MEQYKNLDIMEVPLGSPHFHEKVERFLGANGLRMEALDSYYTVQDTDGNILAGAGISGDIIKCVAVVPDMRSEGLLTPLISRIISGRGNLKVFTKPEYQSLFESLGFKLLASAPLAILMENGRGLQKYCDYLSGIAHAAEENYFSRTAAKNQFPSASTTPAPKIGVVVMNANPFTLGHRYLIEKALEQVDQLFVIPVKEDVSMFPYTERLAMIQAASAPSSAENYFLGHRPKNQFPASSSTPAQADAVMVLEGSDYSISAATFPTYFLKDLSEASETQMLLDLDLFCKHIAPALGATVRFVGSEPTDKLTAQYNTLMAEVLPSCGISVIEIPRLEIAGQADNDIVREVVMPGSDRASHAVSASYVRKALTEGDYSTAAAMCPETTRPYLLAALAERALRMELDTPLKPGLVCPESNGAHKDMDYGTMLKGIAAIRPFFPRMAVADTPEELKQLGIDAEAAMMAATGGVNTHRGAIFALGLALIVAGRNRQLFDTQLIINSTRVPGYLGTLAKHLIDSNLQNTLTGDVATTSLTAGAPSSLIGAKRIALTGYKQLFEDWLPYYRRLPVAAGNDGRVQALLLHIMSTLDDTCIIKRVGKERAEQLKEEIRRSSRRMTEEGSGRMTEGSSRRMTERGPVNDGVLTELCKQFEAEGISPGGAADMVALTIFIDSII